MIPVHGLRGRLGDSWQLLLKELSAFGIVGVACFVLEIGMFQVLYAHVGLGALTSKTLATVVSTTVAYLGHRYWSFSGRARTGLGREYTLFFLVNGLALLLGLAIVATIRYPLGQDGAWALQAANLVSIGAGTVVRYLCYRRWVFPAHDAPHAFATAGQGAPDEATADDHGMRDGDRLSPIG